MLRKRKYSQVHHANSYQPYGVKNLPKSEVYITIPDQASVSVANKKEPENKIIAFFDCLTYCFFSISISKFSYLNKIFDRKTPCNIIRLTVLRYQSTAQPSLLSSSSSSIISRITPETEAGAINPKNPRYM